MTLERKNDWVLFVILMCVFISVFVAVSISICYNSKKDRYNSKGTVSSFPKVSVFSLLGVSLAAIVMRIISHHLSQNGAVILVSAACLLLAILLEMGGGTILRAFMQQ